MKLTRSLAVLIALSAASIPAVSDACPAACPARCHLSDATIRESLPALLRQEGLGSAAAPLAIIRRIELDGDSATEEALVTVVAPELCGPTLACPTLVVAGRAEGLVPLGHGRDLVPLMSRTGGWSDLGVREPTLIPFVLEVTRVLRWGGARYQ